MQSRIRWKEKILLVPVFITVLAFTGPFGTFAALDFGSRVVYWGIAVIGVGAVMNTAVYLASSTGWFPSVSAPAMVLGAVAVGALPGTGVIYLIEWLGLGTGTGTGPLWFIYLAVLAVSIGIVLIDYRSTIFGAGASRSRVASPSETFFGRVNPMIGRDLISLSNQDHYLEVCTTGGKDFVLYRMGDAEEHLEDMGGLRIHRSHWVALAHVTNLRRDGSSYRVDLSDGRSLPVSRPHVKRLRSALAEIATATANNTG